MYTKGQVLQHGPPRLPGYGPLSPVLPSPPAFQYSWLAISLKREAALRKAKESSFTDASSPSGTINS